MEARFPDLKGKGMRLLLYWIVVIMVVVIDQATKEGATKILADGPTVLIPGVLNLVHVENTGAAFSMGEGAGAFFVLVAIAFLIGTLYFVWSTPDLPAPLVCCVGLVAGGGVGNMIDRIMEGSVTDFISAAFINFPVFNVADICITVGIIGAVVGYWAWDTRRERDVEEHAKALHDHDGLDHA